MIYKATGCAVRAQGHGADKKPPVHRLDAAANLLFFGYDRCSTLIEGDVVWTISEFVFPTNRAP